MLLLEGAEASTSLLHSIGINKPGFQSFEFLRELPQNNLKSRRMQVQKKEREGIHLSEYLFTFCWVGFFFIFTPSCYSCVYLWRHALHDMKCSLSLSTFTSPSLTTEEVPELLGRSPHHLTAHRSVSWHPLQFKTASCKSEF